MFSAIFNKAEKRKAFKKHFHPTQQIKKRF